MISNIEFELDEKESIQLSKALSTKKWSKNECESFDAEIWHEENNHVYSIVDDGKAFCNMSNKAYLKDPLAKKLLNRLMLLENEYLEELKNNIEIK